MWTPTWVGERLHAEAIITDKQLHAAVQSMELYNERMEEALLRTGAVDENRLLRFVAERCRTHFVSTAKLSRIEIPRDVLRWIPERIAEKLLAFPVRWEPDTESLSIVSPDAGDPEYVKQLAIATGVKHLKAYVARPAAVKAAIRKWYRGEIQSFAEIATDTFTQIQNTQELYERHVLSEGGLTTKRENRAPLPAPKAEYFRTPLPAAPAPAAPPVPVTPPPPAPSARTTAPRLRQPEPEEPDLLAGLVNPESAAPRARTAAPTRPAPSLPAARRSFSPAPVSEIPASSAVDCRVRDLAELLNVLVSLNENSRDEFRGHSSSVARLSRLMVQRMGLDEVAATHAGIAANLHDLGKPVSYHLTLLNVAQYAPHRTAAQKLVYTPSRLVEGVGLPAEAITAAGAMYERFDGKGFPGRLAGKSIPLGGRILALCDSYSDLTVNPRNPYRKELTHDEAHEVLSKYAGTIFDPDLLELLSQLVVGEDLRRKLTDDKPLVLIAEPDAEEATILELRLVAQGFEVKVARTADQALKICQAGNVRYVLSEIELKPFDGFELLSRLRKSDETREVPFLFVARQSDAAAVDRSFALGAQDFVVKPTSGDVLAGKLRRLQMAAPKNVVSSGVAGSLSDMALPDLVQILHHGRKGGRLKVTAGSQAGEVHFQDGRIVHAIAGNITGQEAFYELLGLNEGTFALEPGFQPTETTIQTSADMLVLEGLRRLDERNR